MGLSLFAVGASTTRSGVPVTYTATGAEQLFAVLFSPVTDPTQAW